MKKGVFIAIEGGEGCGKTTQINLLKEKLASAIFTKEPGGTTFGDQIRALILSDGAKEVSGRTMFGLFLESRMHHVEKVIGPGIKAGKIVISDRYAAATYAYQIKAQQSKELLPIYKEQIKLLKPYLPDLTIVIDLDPKLALERIAKRKGQQLTHFDTRDVAFHERLRKGYRQYAKIFAPKTSVFIDGSASIEAVHSTIWKALTKAVPSLP